MRQCKSRLSPRINSSAITISITHLALLRSLLRADHLVFLDAIRVERAPAVHALYHAFGRRAGRARKRRRRAARRRVVVLHVRLHRVLRVRAAPVSVSVSLVVSVSAVVRAVVLLGRVRVGTVGVAEVGLPRVRARVRRRQRRRRTARARVRLGWLQVTVVSVPHLWFLLLYVAPVPPLARLPLPGTLPFTHHARLGWRALRRAVETRVHVALSLQRQLLVVRVLGIQHAAPRRLFGGARRGRRPALLPVPAGRAAARAPVWIRISMLAVAAGLHLPLPVVRLLTRRRRGVRLALAAQGRARRSGRARGREPSLPRLRGVRRAALLHLTRVEALVLEVVAPGVARVRARAPPHVPVTHLAVVVAVVTVSVSVSHLPVAVQAGGLVQARVARGSRSVTHLPVAASPRTGAGARPRLALGVQQALPRRRRLALPLVPVAVRVGVLVVAGRPPRLPRRQPTGAHRARVALLVLRRVVDSLAAVTAHAMATAAHGAAHLVLRLVGVALRLAEAGRELSLQVGDLGVEAAPQVVERLARANLRTDGVRTRLPVRRGLHDAAVAARMRLRLRMAVATALSLLIIIVIIHGGKEIL